MIELSKISITYASAHHLDEIFLLQNNNFNTIESIYKNNLIQLLDKIIVAIYENKIIGFLIQDEISILDHNYYLDCLDTIPANNTIEDTLDIKYTENADIKYLENLNINCADKLNENDFNINNFEALNDGGDIILQNITEFGQNILYGIGMLCVDENYRNNGIASLLITEHLANTKSSILHVRQNNTNAIKLYEKFGYLNIAKIKNKYCLPKEDSLLYIFKNIN